MLKNYPDSKILACAPSNSAADLILERVAQHNVVTKEEMRRLNAFGRHKSSVSEKILVWKLFGIDPTRVQVVGLPK